MGISEDGLKWIETMWNDPVMKAQGKEYFRQAQDSQTKVAVYDDVFIENADVKSERFPEDWSFEYTST
jgi:hypothetical protein